MNMRAQEAAARQEKNRVGTHPRTSPGRLVLSAVMYSPNLGDGVIAECFSSLARSRERVAVDWLDLAGRTRFEEGSGALRAKVLGLLHALPAPLSDRVSAALVGRQIRTRLAPLAGNLLEGASGLILGGGQLLADANLNFPLKVARLFEMSEARGLPSAINSIGVSQKWSPRATELFRGPLTARGLKFVSVRDQASRDNLAAHYRRYGGAPHPEIAIFPDPGFLASIAVPVEAPDPAGTVGVGVTHPASLRNHGATNLRANVREFAGRFVALGQALRAEGFRVEFFTNGSPDDEDCLAEVAKLLPAGAEGLSVAPRAQTPAALIRRIAAFRGLASHRMHASIVAYSYRIPFLGLSWDPKLEGVFDMMGRRSHLAEGGIADPRATLRAFLGSLRDPIDAAHHAALLDAARAGVDAILAAVRA